MRGRCLLNAGFFLLLLVSLHEVVASNLKTFLAAYPCDLGYNIRLSDRPLSSEIVGPWCSGILLNALHHSCANAATLAKAIVAGCPQTETVEDRAKEALGMVLRSRAHVAVGVTALKLTGESQEVGGTLPQALSEEDKADLEERIGQAWEDVSPTSLHKKELDELALRPEELYAAKFKNIRILYEFIRRSRLLGDAEGIRTIMDAIWRKPLLRSTIPLRTILDASAVVYLAPWRNPLITSNEQVLSLLPELADAKNKPYSGSIICRSILRPETLQKLHYCAKFAKFTIDNRLERVAPLLLDRDPGEKLVFRSPEDDFVTFLRHLLQLKPAPGDTLETAILKFIRAHTADIEWAVPLIQRADMMRAHLTDERIAKLLETPQTIEFGRPFDDSLIIAYARAIFDKLPQKSEDLMSRLKKLRDIAFFNQATTSPSQTGGLNIRFGSLFRGQRLLLEKLMERLLEVVMSEGPRSSAEEGRVRPSMIQLTPGPASLFIVELGDIWLQQQWLLEMVRNPVTTPEEQLLALANLTVGRYKIKQDSRDLLQLGWILGNYREGFALSRVMALDQFPKVYRHCLGDPFWHQVVLLAITDYISQLVKRIDPPHYNREGMETLETWNEAALEVLFLRNAPPTEENQQRLQSLIASHPESHDNPSGSLNDCPRGLARINRSLQRVLATSIQEPSFPELPSVWPWDEDELVRPDPEIFLELLEMLENYRQGLGIVNLVLQAASGTLLNADPQDTQWRRIWSVAFRRAADIRHLDLLLKTVPHPYCDTLHHHPRASPGWTRLTLTVNTHREGLETRRKMVKDLGEYLSEHAVAQEPMHGLAFMLLDTFDSMRDYKTLLGKLYRRYSAKLVKPDLDKVDNSSSLAEQRYRLLRDLLVERLYELDARQGEHADVTGALEGLGRYMFERMLQDSRAFETEPSRITFGTELLAADVLAAEPRHWHAFFDRIIDGQFLKVRINTVSLLTTAFHGLKQAMWKALFAAGVFEPARIENYLWSIRRERQFIDGSASELSKYIVERLKPSEETKTPSEGNLDNTEAGTEDTTEGGKAEAEELKNIEDIILYRVLDFITDPSKAELVSSLYDATTSMAMRHRLYERDNPLDALTQLIRNPPSSVVGLTMLPINASTIAASLFSLLFEKDQPLGPTSLMLNEALKALTLSPEDSFKKAFKVFVLEKIIPLPYSETHALFISRYLAQGPEEALAVMGEQLKTPAYAFSESLRIVLGAEKFKLFCELIPDTPLPPLENSMREEVTEDKRWMRPSEVLLQSLDKVVTDEEIVKEWLQQGNTSKVQLILKAPTPPIIEGCNGRTFEELLQVDPALKDTDMLLTCINHLSRDQLLELLSVPRIFKSVFNKVNPSVLRGLPPYMLTAVTPTQMKEEFSQSLELCALLRDESLMRPLWARDLLQELTPECLRASGPNWFFVFIPISPAHDDPLPHRTYALAAELAAILGPDNFEGINEILYLFADIPSLIFYKNLGRKARSAKEHPCVGAPDDLGFAFWRGMTKECLLAPRASGSTLLATAHASQLSLVDSNVLQSLSPEQLLTFNPDRVPSLPSALRALIFVRLSQSADHERIKAYKDALEKYPRFMDEFREINYNGTKLQY